MSDGITIRQGAPEDAQLIHDFIVELAEYERAREQVRTTPEELRRTLLAPGATARALVALVDGEAAGYAVYFYNYSTWLGKQGLYLEDVYVTPRFRGRGAGKAMLRHLAGIAVAEECGRFEWSVLDWNRPAIDFYEALGARPQSEWITYRLTGQALTDLTEGRDDP